MRSHTFPILLSLAVASNALAESIELPTFPVGLEGQTVRSEPNAFIEFLIATMAVRIASGGKLILFPISGPKDAKVLFKFATPNQTTDTADEVFTIALHERTGDTEDQATSDLVRALNKLCPEQPARKISTKNGITLVERESQDCLRPGYRYTLNRFLAGNDGVYQIVYLSRKKAPTAIDVEVWAERLSQARVVP